MLGTNIKAAYSKDNVCGVWMKKDELDLYSLMTLGGNGRDNVFIRAKECGQTCYYFLHRAHLELWFHPSVSSILVNTHSVLKISNAFSASVLCIFKESHKL